MNIECTKVHRHLSAYLDGTLSHTDHPAISRHLKRCTDCRQALVDLEKLVKTIGEVPPTRAPADFVQRLRSRIGGETLRKRFFRRLFVPLRIKLPLEFAAVAAVAVLIFFVATPQPSKKMGRDMTMDAALEQAVPKTTGPAPVASEPEALNQAARVRYKTLPAATAKPTGEALVPFGPPPASPSKLIELAMVLKPTTAPPPASGPPPRQSGKSGPEDAPQNEVVGTVQRQSVIREMRSTQPQGKNAPVPAPVDSPGNSPPQTSMDTMRHLVAEAGGTVIFEENITAPSPGVLVAIEIPAAVYTRLCNRLQTIGRFETSPPQLETGQKDTVRILLRLISDGQH